MLVFLDESSFDKRIRRRFGYSFRGTRAQIKRKHTNWGPRITAIPAISTEGILDVGIYRGKVNEGTFLTFVRNVLAPVLLPFNGENPRSIVVMDNAAIHHTDAVINAINQTGALILFLPPYSPDFNPCENLFSQTKSWIKENDMIWRSCDFPENMVFEAFLNISDDNVRNCIRHAEYI
ncbi:uncharacterized protein LOC110232230 [Exaiptasia diaphana]|uniref:Tc1-like transposase DDE domain-containing protein n=1 Tax=Exaiptasia diaphana TaxID=2652724 RepID=A0A913WRK0_EXADI|nr:uncharacterized protein LOC110232230 [Exaiptasia diaphana]